MAAVRGQNAKLRSWECKDVKEELLRNGTEQEKNVFTRSLTNGATVIQWKGTTEAAIDTDGRMRPAQTRVVAVDNRYRINKAVLRKKYQQ